MIANNLELIGIGFGPSNLALAVAITEMAGESVLSKALFLESKPAFAWHPGMMLEDGMIQVSCLKDLATLRNPQSSFGFLTYLHEKDRLNEFINMKSFFPTRVELNDYFNWAASRFVSRVNYGHKVIEIRPLLAGQEVEALEVIALRHADQELVRYRCQDLVLAAGKSPAIPEGIALQPGGRAFHSSCFLDVVNRRFPDHSEAYRFVVVGGGQSAAEVFHYLSRNYRNAEVKVMMSGFAFAPMDDSCFVNEIFFPKTVELFVDLSPEGRKELLQRYRHTNYSAVDAELLTTLYRLLYDEKVKGRSRLKICSFHRLESLVEKNSVVEVAFRELISDQQSVIEADGVVLATGYRNTLFDELLRPISSYFERDDQGNVKVTRDYQIIGVPQFKPKVFLQGYCEDTHGISDTLLSLLPIRAGKIVDALLEPKSLAASAKSPGLTSSHVEDSIECAKIKEVAYGTD
jgi:L-ornithine N5-monooxygenase